MPQWSWPVQTVRPDLTVRRSRKLTLADVLSLTVLGACWLMWAVADAGFDRYHLPKESWLTLAALVCALTGARHAGSLRGDACTKPTLASLGVAALAAAFATTPVLALRPLSLQLAASVLFLTARALPRELVPRVLGAIVVAASGVALLGLAEGFGWVAGLSREGRAPGSTLGQRNSVAHLLLLASPIAWQLSSRGRPAARSLACAASALLAATIVMTRSRAAWLGLAAALLVYVSLVLFGGETRGDATRVGRASAARSASLVPVGAVLLGVLLMLVAPTRLVWRQGAPYADTFARLVDVTQGSGAGRLAQYRASLAIARLHPLLGAGPGNWMVEYPRVSPLGDPAFRARTWLHTGRLANSDWIALLTEQGALALLLALALLFVSARALRHAPERAAAFALLAALLLVGALDAVLQLPAPLALTALGLGCLLPRAPQEPAATPRRRGLFAATSLALAFLLALASWSSAQRLLALWARTRPQGGYAAAERAVAWYGADLSARFALAEAYVLSGDCAKARPHLTALRRLLPYHRAPRLLGCGAELPDS